MKPVVQQDPTGCGIASVAIVCGLSYARPKAVAASLGIAVTDRRVWSDTALVRRLLRQMGRRVAPRVRAFRSWEALPECALLAIKWRRVEPRPAWHWVVFRRDKGQGRVLDSYARLATPVRRDFGRMKPKWYLRIEA